MKAKDYLLQLEKLDKLIENKLAEKVHWKSVALNTTAPMDSERVQSSGSQQKIADAVIRYIDIEREIDCRIDELVDKRKEVISTIEQLPAAEYDVLHKMYVQYWVFQDIASAHDKSYSWATTVHGRALQHLQEILDRRGSNERETGTGRHGL